MCKSDQIPHRSTSPNADAVVSTGHPSSEIETLSCSPTNCQNMLKPMEKFDKQVSSFVFRLSLPPIIEAIYSVPANFFGLVPSLAIFPLWLAILVLEDGVYTDGRISPGLQEQNSKILLLKTVTVLLTAVFLVAWGFFQNGNIAAFTKVLGQKYFYLLAIVFNVAFLSYTVLELPPDDPYAASSRKAFSIPIYILFLWPPTLLVILILKHHFQRERPIVMDATQHAKGERWSDRKAFPIICWVLNHAQPKESFPSGDATSAAIFAIALANINPRYNNAAWTLLFLVCTGRMYFLVHYFFDVVAGSVIAYALYEIMSFVGLGIYDMEWWYPLASTILLAAYVQTKMKTKYNSKLV